MCQLVNADNPHWLVGITEMTRTFGLELLESVMSGYPQLFLNVGTFKFIGWSAATVPSVVIFSLTIA